MLTYSLENRKGLPLYESLYRHIRQDILDGTLQEGERLPSKRALAEHLRLSVITVESAYQQLEAEGYVYTLPRRGFFVSRVERSSAPAMAVPVSPPPASPVWRLDLRSNQVDHSRFPAATWARLTRQVLSEGGNAFLSPIPHQGLPALRQAIADDLRDFRGMSVSPEQIVIGAGAEYLYMLLAQLLGRDAVFALEDPGYSKIRQVYTRCGAACLPIPLDGQGLDLSALSQSAATVAHISPSHHYPTGVVTSIGRRQALLRWAEAVGGTIIEDDYDSEFRFEGRMPQTLFSEDVAERVIYINTFAETISPSLRISYMILPSDLMKKFRKEMSFYSCTVPSFEQYTLAAFLSEGYFEKHVNRMRLSFKQKRSEIVQAARGFSCLSVDSPAIGMNLLFRFSSEKSDAEIKRELLRRGVKMNFVSDYLYRENGKYNGMAIVNFARADKESILKGAEILESVAFCGN